MQSALRRQRVRRAPHQIPFGILICFLLLILVVRPASAHPLPQSGDGEEDGIPTQETPFQDIPYLRGKAAEGLLRGPGGADPHFSLPAAATGITAATAENGGASDDFNRANLDPARWTLINPLNDGAVRMVGVGAGDAHLELTLPQGQSHDPWNANRALRVMQPASNGDFQITVKFDSTPTQKYQMQGLILEQDADNWLRLEIQHDGSALRIFTAATLNGSTQSRGSQTVTPGAVAYLRVIRTGDNWDVAYSSEGAAWSSPVSFTQPITITAMGPFVANHASAGDPSPAFTARVDYISNTAAPVSGEDSSAVADTLAPLIHTVQTSNDIVGETIVWNTDEPALGVVEYGTSPAYGMSQSDGGGIYAHAIQLTGLTPGVTYHYRIKSLDSGGRESVTDDATFVFSPQGTDGPEIVVWYGDRQNVGQLGRPQIWFNLLGNVSDPDGVAELTYTLNGGVPVAGAIGPDGKRLENIGDFNLDMAMSGLQNGENQVVITARDELGNISNKEVILVVSDNGPWPLPYSIDWKDVNTDAEIQNVAQVVDGKWRLENGAVRTAEPGYDRLIAVGDVLWRDYEAIAPVTIHSEPASGERGVGLLLRWTGHTDVPRECAPPLPKCGWQPLGALAWYHGRSLELFSYDPDACETNSCTRILGVPKSSRLDRDVTYWFKVQVKTSADVGVYGFKVWPVGDPEPEGWDTEGTALPQALGQGSLLLLSHRIDASFGPVQVTPIGLPQLTILGDNPLILEAGNPYVEPGAIAIDPEDGDISGQIQIDSSAVNTNEPGVYTVTYSVTDSVGNKVEAERTVNVVDTTPPVITLLGDNPLTHEAGTPYVDPGATAVDNVDGDLTAAIVIGGDAVNSEQLGTYVVTYDVSDAAGNAAVQRTRTVSVVDTTPPVITLLGDNPLTHEAGTPYVEPGATAVDNVDGDLTAAIVVGGDEVNSDRPGTYTVTYDVTDATGNPAIQRTRTVSVVDTTPPVITLLGDNPLTLTVGDSYTDPGATAVDNVDGDLTAAIIVGGDNVDAEQVGEYTVTYDVTDAAGNRAPQVRRLVRVLDKNGGIIYRVYLPVTIR